MTKIPVATLNALATSNTRAREAVIYEVPLGLTFSVEIDGIHACGTATLGEAIAFAAQIIRETLEG